MSSPNPPQPRRWTLDEIQALKAQRRAEQMGVGMQAPAPSVLMPATFGGPNPAMEAQQAAQQARGAQSPGAAAETATANMAEGLQEQGKEAIAHPVHTALSIGGAMVGGPVGEFVGPARRFLPLAGSAARLVRLSSGNILRAGSPVMQAGARVFDRALGAGIGAMEGGQLGRPQDESSPEAIRRRLLDFSMGAAGEAAESVFGLGKAGVQAARRAPGNLIRYLRGQSAKAAASPTVKGAADALAILKRYNQSPSLGQVLESKGQRAAESILRSAFGSQGVYSTADEGAEAAAWQAWHDALPQFGQQMSEQEISDLLEDAIVNRAQGAKRAAVTAAYDHAEQVARDKGVSDNVVIVDDIVRQLYNDEGLQAKAAAGNPMAAAIKATLERLVDPGAIPAIRAAKGINHAPITFQQAEAFRSALLDRVRAEGYGRLASPYVELMDKAMETAADRLAVPEAHAAYKAARALSSEEHTTFGGDILGSIIDKVRPEQIAQTIFRDGNPSGVQAVWKVIDDPQYAPQVQAAVAQVGGKTVQDLKDAIVNGYLAQLERKAGERTSTATGEVLTQGSGKRLLSYLTTSRGTIEALIPDARQRETLEKLARTIEITQSRPTARSGTVWFQLTQARTTAKAVKGVQAGLAGATQGAGLLLGAGTEASMLAAGWLTLPGGLAALIRAPGVVNWMQNRAVTAAARQGTTMGRFVSQVATRKAEATMADLIGRLTNAGVAFIHTAPDGQQTISDPQQGVYGAFAPTAAGRAKPVAKTPPVGR